MKALILAETEDALRELAAGARALAEEVIAVCIDAAPVPGVADKTAHIAVPEGSVVEDAYLTLNDLFDTEKPELVLVEPTRRMKALAGRLAAHASTSTITDAISFDGELATCLYFGGVGERSYRANSQTTIVTIGAGVFDASLASGSDQVEERAFKAPERAIKKLSSEPLPAVDVDLVKCDIVVGVGRGFVEEPELELARALCDKLGAGLGCSRPLTEGVDWMPKGTYIGVSGLTLSPKVYMACGISGQMQHMVGVNRAQTIVAVNKDKNAPIFKQCDLGLIGDVKTVLPELTAFL